MSGIPLEFKAKPINIAEFDSAYVKWALQYFVDEQKVSDPYLAITLDLDISQAYTAFNKGAMGASFTAVMMYALMHSIKEIPCLRYRYYEKKWYLLENPPLMMPVAVGGSQRFVELIIPNVLEMSWVEFSRCYSQRLKEIKNSFEYSPAENEKTFLFSQFIGNLPNMRFTGFKLHAGRVGVQNTFYFGKRERDVNDRFIVPFAMNLHHANADPFIGQQLVERFEYNLLSIVTM